MNDETALILVLGVLFVLFTGCPDFADAIMYNLTEDKSFLVCKDTETE